MYPEELYTEFFNLILKLNAKVAGVEVTSLNEFIVQPIKNEMHKRGQFFELIELKARQKKENRIAALAPFYRQGYIFHNPNVTSGLESQLMSFPRSKYWDIMDAFAYIIEMLEIGERYFEPPDLDDPEAEYAELEYEKPLNNWQYAPEVYI